MDSQLSKPKLVPVLGKMNVGPADFYSRYPCYVGYAFLRIEVTGHARACCIAKHSIGKLEQSGGWRAVWRSTAYEAFRAKMLRISKEKFHLTDPEYFYCQQCSNFFTNRRLNKAALIGQ
jgi:Iron-sulfur cluster-binding domain